MLIKRSSYTHTEYFNNEEGSSCSCYQLTEQNLDGAFAHVVVGIKGFASLLAHLGHHLAGVFVEQVDEALQDVQVECGCYQLAVRSPFISYLLEVRLITSQ